MIEDQVCRICGELGSSEEPLFHPCKCTGSIRHIHEICLVKWLSIKSTGHAHSTASSELHAIQGMRCELCGYFFEFAPEYSVEYKSSSAVGLTFALAVDIVVSILTDVYKRSCSWIRGSLALVGFPFVMGLMILSVLTRITRTADMAYGVSIYSLSQSWLRTFIIGSVSAVLGSFAFERMVDQPRPNARTLANLLGVSLIGIPAGLAFLIIPYLVGLEVVTLISSQTGGALAASLPDLTVSPLLDISADLGISSLGFLAVSLAATLVYGIAQIRQMQASEVHAISQRYLIKTVRILSALVVPLAVGEIVKEAEILNTSWIQSRSTRIGSWLLTMALGCLVTVPTVLTQRFITAHVMSSHMKNQISRTGPTYLLLCGRNMRGLGTLAGPSQAAIIRMVLHIALMAVAFYPAIIVLRLINILPLSQTPVSAVTSQFSLPFEFLYAHVLIPLVLNAPPVPRSVDRRWRSFKRMARETTSELSWKTLSLTLLAVAMILFTSSITVIGLPLLVGRAVLGRHDDLVAFSIGFIVILGSVHIALRTMASNERASAVRATQPLLAGTGEAADDAAVTETSDPGPSTPISESWAVRGFSLVGVGALGIFVLPLLIGMAFHLALILPMRDSLVAVQVDPSDSSALLTRILPLWIIGIMIMKIALAVSTTGLIPSLRNSVTEVAALYEREGLLSFPLHRSLFLAFFVPSITALGLHCYIPYILGLYLGTGDFTVLVYLGIVGSYRLVLPRLLGFLRKQREIVFNKKYLVRTRLRNFQATPLMDDTPL